MSNIKIILTGGGTGGHIAPLLAVGDEILKINKNIELIYVGRKEDVASTFFHDRKMTTKTILAGKLRRYFSWQNFTDIFKTIIGFFQSMAIILKVKPKLVFAKGGFVSVPVAVAAKICRVPIIAQESDVVLGLANRIVSRWAKKIACGFDPDNYIDLKTTNLVYTGNPVRADFIKESEKSVNKSITIGKRKTEGSLPLLLVMGSSQGAHRINELVLPILPDLLEIMNVVHISGRGDYLWLENERNRLSDFHKKRYYLYSFLAEELPSVIHRADLVISRSSASSIAELSILQKATILIPLSTSASNHQWHNAKIYERQDAAIIVDERKAKPDEIKKLVLDLIPNTKGLHNLRNNIATLAEPKAAEKLAKLILDEINNNHEKPKSKT